MNQIPDFNKIEKIFKLQRELNELQAQQELLTKENHQ